MKSLLLLSFLFLFLILPLVEATTYYSGSSYFLDFPKCERLNITAVCSNRIDLNEFYFSPNCELVENSTFVWKWSCNCSDGYRLNFTINPASENECDLIFTCFYLVVTEEKVENKYYSVSSAGPINQTILNITNVTVVNQTLPVKIVNQTIEKWYENTTRIGELEQKVEEYERIEKFALVLFLVLLLTMLAIVFVNFMKRRQIE